VQDRVTGMDTKDAAEIEKDASHAATPPSHNAPGYRRALWIVVLLNVGYGVVEMIGGFIASSQAVKADLLLAFIVAGLFLHSAWSIIARA
jgi:Co/Zn/Cd efflux system component